MSFTRRKLLHRVAGVLALPALPRIACAQSFPNRPITIIVPYPPGGPTDTIARLLAERMRGSLGQPVVIENVSGAGGNIGVGRVAKAAGDGYTLSIGHWGSHVVNGAVYTLPFDLLTDLVPVALIAEGPQLIVAAKSVPARGPLRGNAPPGAENLAVSRRSGSESTLPTTRRRRRLSDR